VGGGVVLIGRDDDRTDQNKNTRSHMPTITALYAGLLGLVSMVIAFKAGRLRGKKNIPLGDGGDRELLLAMRRQSNFVEYVPLALILIGLLELNHVQPIALHTLGAALVVARVQSCHRNEDRHHEGSGAFHRREA
jgi:uncharacterized membrane protein YecN with MAPEG domain